ncbi:MAG: hypothetical protein SCH71_04885 [Desulfobulbaceae bacterium]|nr:hypothetical protein [Desulfobulbaceae bacterium]
MKCRGLLRLSTISILFFTLGLLCINSEIPASETAGIDRCGSISLEEAAALLGVSVDDLARSSSDLMVSPDDLRDKIYKETPYNCSIRAKSNLLKSITYVTYVYSDPVQARIEFNRMRDGFESVSRVDEVPDAGDEAFLAGDQRFHRLIVKKGDTVIDILSPADFTLQKQVVHYILETETN